MDESLDIYLKLSTVVAVVLMEVRCNNVLYFLRKQVVCHRIALRMPVATTCNGILKEKVTWFAMISRNLIRKGRYRSPGMYLKN